MLNSVKWESWAGNWRVIVMVVMCMREGARRMSGWNMVISSAPVHVD